MKTIFNFIRQTLSCARAVFRNIPLFLELDRLDEEGQSNSPRAHHIRETIKRDLSIHHCLR